ncbi:hypothetical protein HPP92_003476 [Vanilla planifolia]|uniref:Uncharacterized protein n=1 Tax=Vanilla planifolia TaxID=51239 RepID=A0A835RUH5_VANPL|nr:hypothetical protein HPP92_003476 [Vanilla planifolia]
MVETGFLGRDLRRGFMLEFGSNIQLPFQQRSDGGVGFGIGGVLKRSTRDIEDQQDSFLRSVKQKTDLSSPPPLRSSPSSVSAPLERQGISNSSIWSFSEGVSTVEAQFEKKFDLKKRLLELERHLIDDEEEEEVSGSNSVIASNEWSSTMQKLVPPQPPNRHPLSPASTTSTSSSCSSSSRSPSQATPSRLILLDTAKAISEGNLKMASDNLIFFEAGGEQPRRSRPAADGDDGLRACLSMQPFKFPR